MHVQGGLVTLAHLSCHRVTLHCHDESARFIRMLTGVGKNYLTEEDFEILVQVGTWQGRGLKRSMSWLLVLAVGFIGWLKLSCGEQREVI